MRDFLLQVLPSRHDGIHFFSTYAVTTTTAATPVKNKPKSISFFSWEKENCVPPGESYSAVDVSLVGEDVTR